MRDLKPVFSAAQEGVGFCCFGLATGCRDFEMGDDWNDSDAPEASEPAHRKGAER